MPPCRPGSGRQGLGIGEFASAFAIGSNKVGVAPHGAAAGSARAITLATRPKIAAREAAKHRDPSCICSFALQSAKELFYRVAHSWRVAWLVWEIQGKRENLPPPALAPLNDVSNEPPT